MTLPSARPEPLQSGGPGFPVDDLTLDLLDHALNGVLTYPDGVDPDDGPVLIAADPTKPGGEFDLHELLDFLSGYDPAQKVLLEDGAVPIYEYTGGVVYSQHDVIRALVAEIRRLRAKVTEGGTREGSP